MNRPLWSYEGLDEKTVLKLKSNGFNSKEDVQKNIEGAQKICEHIQDVVFKEKSKCIWQTGHEVLKQERERICLTTLSKYLDELLHGGIEMGKLTEIYGNSGSGKTQLCLQLALNVTLPMLLGGLEAESIYIETNKSVFASRLLEMCEAFVDYVKRNLEMKEKVCDKADDVVVRGKEKETWKKIMVKDRHMLVRGNQNINENKQGNKIGQIDDTLIEQSANKPKRLEANKTNGPVTSKESTYPINNLPSKKLETNKVTNNLVTKQSTNSTNNLVNKANDSREFNVNMTRKDLEKLINQSKASNTHLNKFLHEKITPHVRHPNDVHKASILSKVHVHYCTDYYEILALVMNIENHLTQTNVNIKLIVIDNITFLFHNEQNSNYLKRTKDVYFLLNLLSDMAKRHNLAVILINQLTTKYFDSNQRKVVPALGETFAHRVQTRLLLQKVDGLSQEVESDAQLFMCLIDKMCVHNAEMIGKKHVLFQINTNGIRDV
ncbi:DNA repair protein RAD51 homolog 3-like [Diaphorina citri]|uniref:DNA repair protein RAD51 homolog 3 n=1 Tax=Diaphorina citri TaxID=121845 RepID=A0A3Q0JDX6_DIACI|nr:DNA repair protein RAD51 homolog 3-like [Diaphorina citri]